MNETVKYCLKKSIRWIWVALIIGIICSGYLWIKNQGTNIGDEYSGNWEQYPEAHRYGIYMMEIKPEAFALEGLQQNAIGLLSQYDELIRQSISSTPNTQKLYRALIQQFPDLFPEYTSSRFLEEMIAVYWSDTSTLICCANAPKSIQLTKYTDTDYCEMRDFVSKELIKLVEDNEYIKTLPVYLRRTATEIESSLSEQLLISDIFSEKENGFSIKKAIIVFVGVSIISYIVLLIIIMANGRIKSGEELESTTNLEVYDDFLKNRYDEAVKQIKTKLSTKNQQNKLFLLYDNTSTKEEVEKLATDLGEEMIPIQFIECNDALQTLKNQDYLLIIKQNKTRKQILRFLAKELAQINANCVGAVIIR